MPIYEYRCSACGHELEALQKMGDDALMHCPECHGETLQKKISAAGFQLKGTGWYATDFKHSGSAPGAGEKATGEKKAGDNNSADKSQPTKSKSSSKGSQAA